MIIALVIIVVAHVLIIPMIWLFAIVIMTRSGYMVIVNRHDNMAHVRNHATACKAKHIHDNMTCTTHDNYSIACPTHDNYSMHLDGSCNGHAVDIAVILFSAMHMVPIRMTFLAPPGIRWNIHSNRKMRRLLSTPETS